MQNVVNGYQFKGKPMVIQFGRNPAAAKENLPWDGFLKVQLSLLSLSLFSFCMF